PSRLGSGSAGSMRAGATLLHIGSRKRPLGCNWTSAALRKFVPHRRHHRRHPSVVPPCVIGSIVCSPTTSPSQAGSLIAPEGQLEARQLVSRPPTTWPSRLQLVTEATPLPFPRQTELSEFRRRLEKAASSCGRERRASPWEMQKRSHANATSSF